MKLTLLEIRLKQCDTNSLSAVSLQIYTDLFAQNQDKIILTFQIRFDR